MRKIVLFFVLWVSSFAVNAGVSITYIVQFMHKPSDGVAKPALPEGLTEENIVWVCTLISGGTEICSKTNGDQKITWDLTGGTFTGNLSIFNSCGAGAKVGDIVRMEMTINAPGHAYHGAKGTTTATVVNGATVSTGAAALIFEEPVIIPKISVSSVTFCAGAANQTVKATFTDIPADIASYTIDWDNPNITTAGGVTADGATGNISASLAAGTYNLTAKLMKGTSEVSTAAYTVTVNPIPQVTIVTTPADGEVCMGATLALEARVSGATGTLTYAWEHSGGGNKSIQKLTFSNVGSETATNYAVTVTANNCSSSKVSKTIVIKQLPVVTLKAEPTNICGGTANDVTLTASCTNAKTYTWTNAATIGTGASGTVSANATTTYKVRANGDNGCQSAEASATVTAYSVGVTIGGTKQVNYDASTTLTATVGTLPAGISVDSYSWTPIASINGAANAASMTTANLKSTTSYTVEVKDNKGCKGSANATVTVVGGALAVNPTGGNKLYCTGSLPAGGELNAGDSDGSGTATYEWTSSPAGLVLDKTDIQRPKIQPTSTDGTYSVTVKVTKGSETKTGTLSNVKVYKTPVLGNISVTPTAPSEGESAELELASVDPSAATLKWSGTPLASTSGLKVSTGVLTAGGHTYTVEADNNGCKATKSATVTVGKMDALVVNPPATTPKGNIDSPITATVTASGGAGNYDYKWEVPADVTLTGTGASVTLTSSVPGTKNVCVTVTSGGQSEKACFNVMVLDPSVVDLIASIDRQCATPGAFLTITIEGQGAEKYSFNLRDKSNTIVQAVNAAATWQPYKVQLDAEGTYRITDFKYSISGVESAGNVSNPVIEAKFDVLPNVYAMLDNQTTLLHCEGEKLALKGTGDPGLEYSWDNGVIDGVEFDITAGGTYTVTGKDPNTGCVNTSSVTVTLNPRPVVVMPEAQEICADELVTLTATSDEPDVTFVWSNGVINDQAFKPMLTAVYELNATNAAGCVTTDSVKVTVNQAPHIVDNSKNPRNIAIGKDVYFKVVVDADATYQWFKKEGDEWNLLEDITSSMPIIIGSATDSISLLSVPKTWDGTELKVVATGLCGKDSMEFQLNVRECFEIEAELEMVAGIIPDEDPGNGVDGWYCRGQEISLKTVITAEEDYEIENAHYRWLIDGEDLAEEHLEMVSDTAVLTWIPSQFIENDFVVRVYAYCDGACEEVAAKRIRLKAREYEDVAVKIMTDRDPSDHFCAGDTVNFWLATKNVGKTPQYTWYNDIFELPNQQSPFNELIALENDKVTLVMGQEDSWMRVVMVPSPEVCMREPMLSDSLIMRKKPWVEPTLTIDYADTMVCKGDTVPMWAVQANAGSEPTFQWQRSIGAPFPDWNLGTDYFATVFVDEEDVWVKCTMTPSKDVCYDKSEPIVAAVKISVFKEDPEVIITCDMDEKTAGEELVFEAEVRNILGEPLYEWYVDEMLAPVNEPEYVTDNLKQGSVVYCLVSGEKVCQTKVKSNEIIVDFGAVNRDTMLVIYRDERIKDLNMLKEGDVPSALIFMIETPANFGMASISPEGLFTYLPNAGFIGTDHVKYVILNRSDKSVVSDGYIYITVKESDRFFVPNLITPNDDGLNDTWVLDFLADYPNHLIQVFDRDGRIVFEARNYQNDWGGEGVTKSGYVGHINLVNGIYTYIIDLGDKDKTVLKSWLEIRANLNRGNYR